jgi:3-deoxy-D-manno-octulosonic-acid transferase
MWLIYNILFPLVFIVLLPRFLMRICRRGGYKSGFLHRFGIYNKQIISNLKKRPRVWIHAVSVGEVNVALEFIKQLRKYDPETAFVLTATTSTGYKIAQSKTNKMDIVLYFPLDFPVIIKRVLDIIKPESLILIECEFWPNLIRLAHKKGIPVFLVNGRISDSSFKGYKKLKPFVQNTFSRFTAFCVQSEKDKSALSKLGAENSKIHITGSAKFDLTNTETEINANPFTDLLANVFPPHAKFLVGGSTWPGEELLMVNVYKKIREFDDSARLILVPRHAERTPEILSKLKNTNISIVKRSELDSNKEKLKADKFDAVLVNTTGELKFIYQLANLIFVGKSLTQHGGQNIIEPAAFAKPVVVGPFTENFPSVVKCFLNKNAIIQVHNIKEFYTVIIDLWKDDITRKQLGFKALEVVRSNSGNITAAVQIYLNNK